MKNNNKNFNKTIKLLYYQITQLMKIIVNVIVRIKIKKKLIKLI